MRDMDLEEKLQAALDAGHRVWAVGDVHGFHETALQLLEALQLKEGDHVVFLGDLIDRGPDSHGMVQTVKQRDDLCSVKGNHEAMMVEQFHGRLLNDPDLDFQLWMHNGGRTTLDAYMEAHTNDNGRLALDAMLEAVAEDREWMDGLPTHVVLNQWRLVHAGYDPNQALTMPSEESLLWVREPFHRAAQPIDEHRTVVFGHTPTVAIHPRGRAGWGEVYRSPVTLGDGRPSIVGLDTCLYHSKQAPKRLSAFDLQHGEVRQVDRVEA